MTVKELAKELWLVERLALESVFNNFNEKEIQEIWDNCNQEIYLIQAQHILDNLVGRVDEGKISYILHISKRIWNSSDYGRRACITVEQFEDVARVISKLPVRLEWKK